ncbi:adenylate/guanylate cyclase domain-containing protein [Candidatus Woesearchaeota archaeon]|nr:adenylate/guanylate cyclase domain-containing protein [Candidatus Woesearchaeota archaeon]
MIQDKGKTYHCMFLGLGVASIVLFLFFFGAFSSYQARLHDTLFGGGHPLDKIVIIAIDDASLQELGRWPWDRKLFAELLPKLRQAKAVGIDVVFSEPSSNASDMALAEAIQSNGNVILPVEYTGFEVQHDVLVGTKALLPLSMLKPKGLGVINLVTDADGVTRSANTNIRGPYPLFAEAIAKQVVTTDVPRSGHLLINMLGPRGTFRTLPFKDALHADPTQFKDAIVFIGATAPDLHDDYLAPASGGTPVPGVEIQATLVHMILTKTYVFPEPWWGTALSVTLSALFVAFLMAKLNAWVVAFISLILLITHLIAAVLLFRQGILLDIVFLSLSLLGSYVTNLVHLFIHERRQKKQIAEAFSKYVAPEIIKELLKHPEKLRLGGEKRTITIFFSDVRGFTTLSEKLSPEMLVHLLNEYLTAMTDIILASGGIVDKYIGDAIMAFWGAPLDQPDHAERASRVSLRMLEKLAELQKKWETEGFPRIDIGIGLNTGDAVIGNMGSTQRFDYTCMGDTINLGSRLEGLNKEYGTAIIISESTRKLLPAGLQVRELDMVKVKGKKEPITIYELLGTNVAAERKKMLSIFTTALKKYRKQLFTDALTDFEKAATLGDKTASAYVTRCQYFLEHPPAADWDGVWEMKTK